MELTYLGHSCFRIKGKSSVVVTDPFSSETGWLLEPQKADIVTISHNHHDHNAISRVKARGDQSLMVVEHPGEYEIGGVSIVGRPSWHDASEGSERGRNIIFSIYVDDVHIVHLGDLGHPLSDSQMEAIGTVDILLIPVGGQFTIDSVQAEALARAIEPRFIVPMHYRLPNHAESFAGLETVESFAGKWGSNPTPAEKLVVNATQPDEDSETELVILQVK